ncbi:MAG: hypothetical protein Q9165_003484 [Trypethelium subeluteriae]
MGSMVGPVLALSVFFVVATAIYRLFLHPLAKFPGPRLAALTRWYEGYYDVIKNGQYEFKIQELHRIYGPIVRISPYELHIDDPSFFNEIYRRDGRWDKYDFSTKAQTIPGAAVFTADHEIHKRRRAPLNPFLSQPAVAKRMDLVQDKIALLQNRISDLAERRTAFNIGNAFSAMTVDIVTDYVMGQSYNSLTFPDFNANFVRMLQAAGTIWRYNKHIPFLGYMMRLMPLSLVEKIGDDKTKSFLTFMKVSEARTQDIMDSHHAGKRDLSADPPTLVDEIISAPNLPSFEKKYQRVNDDVTTVMGGGFESTAQMLRQTSYHIYANPSILQRLRAELNALSLTGDWTSKQLEQLPYLTSVLKEGLRLSPGLGTRMGRVTNRPIEYNGDKTSKVWTIPPRTPVGMTTLNMHMDDDIFAQPKKFKPERWLDSDEATKKRMEKHFHPFSRGTRMCLGMHLAWVELYLTVAMLVSQFDLQLTGGTNAEDVEWASDTFIIGVKGKNGINVIATKVKN